MFVAPSTNSASFKAFCWSGSHFSALCLQKVSRVSKVCFLNVIPSLAFQCHIVWSLKFSPQNIILHLCRCKCTDFCTVIISACYFNFQVRKLYQGEADLLERNPVLIWRFQVRAPSTRTHHTSQHVFPMVSCPYFHKTNSNLKTYLLQLPATVYYFVFLCQVRIL